MALFEKNKESIPLAERMRPQELEDFVGQEHLLGEDKFLAKAIKTDSFFSMIFWGPPGSGKTTLAKIIAHQSKAKFVYFSAVDVSTKEIKIVIQEARQILKAYNQRTILFLDEIHRFNKSQQAIFLPYVEDGSIILIASTTENPSFEVISPLLSRCRVFILNSLSESDIKKIINRTMIDAKNGLGNEKTEIKDKDLDFLAGISNGDARIALNTLELAVKISNKNKQGVKIITSEIIAEALQKKNIIYDKKGEEHYNLASAFIKSMRGSDVDAAIYWLARMLEGGEDPEFIVRRMIIFASEDIGNADPMALVVATSAVEALKFVGLPEAQLNLAQAVVYLARAPKSNASYLALLRAKEDVKKRGNLPVPIHLRNAPTKFMSTSVPPRRDYGGSPEALCEWGENLGYGKDYPPATPERSDGGRGKYPHNFPGAKVKQDYLPDSLRGRKYYYHPKFTNNNKS